MILNGNSLFYASDRLKKDLEIVLNALVQKRESFRYVSLDVSCFIDVKRISNIKDNEMRRQESAKLIDKYIISRVKCNFYFLSQAGRKVYGDTNEKKTHRLRASI